MRTVCAILLLAWVSTAFTEAQTPQPFPQPGESSPTRRVARPSLQPVPADVSAQTPPAPGAAAAQAAAPSRPDDAPVLNVPIYPTAQYLMSYDAGRGQRYHLFGTTASFADLVTYYRTQLRERGNLVFEEPPTHMFDLGRFRDDTMAFPPSVTVKDWTFGGSQGYPNPRRGAEPPRFPTVVVIVPPPGPEGAAR
jgi:hypothetical protein